MDLDFHITRFDWAGTPAAIGPGVARLARTAEAIGVKTLSVMDHYFQMDAVAPAEDPMLEGYTTLGFIAAVTQRLRLRVLVTGVTYRPPGLLAKIVTTLEEATFYAAEAYHQDFLERNPTHPYIAYNDLPKVRDLRSVFPSLYRAEPALVLARPRAR